MVSARLPPSPSADTETLRGSFRLLLSACLGPPSPSWSGEGGRRVCVVCGGCSLLVKVTAPRVASVLVFFQMNGGLRWNETQTFSLFSPPPVPPGPRPELHAVPAHGDEPAQTQPPPPGPAALRQAHGVAEEHPPGEVRGPVQGQSDD